MQSSLADLAFYLLAGAALAGAVGVAWSSNIVYSALSLMVSFLGVAGLYVLLNADFVAGVQILIYVGGVLVLTLFAVMLTHHIADMQVSNRSVARPFALLIVAGTFVVLVAAIATAPWHVAEQAAFRSTEAIGNLLLSRYLLPFELASLVLLAVLVGAVVLSRKEVAETTVRAGDEADRASVGGSWRARDEEGLLGGPGNTPAPSGSGKVGRTGER